MYTGEFFVNENICRGNKGDFFLEVVVCVFFWE